MPSSRSRACAPVTSCAKIHSPALSCTTTSLILSHSGVAYSGWLPTSRYSRAPFSRKTLDERPQLTTRRKRYRATSSGLSRRWPRRVKVTPYSFSIPKMRRSTEPPYCRLGQKLRQLLVGHPAEGTPPVAPAQGGHLQIGRGERAVRPGQGGGGGLERRREVPSLLPGGRNPLVDGLGIAPEDGEVVLVGDRPLVGDVVQLIGPGGVAQLGDQDLDLEGLHLVGEHVPEILGVEVGQPPGVHVLAAVGVPLGVGVAHAGHPQLVVLVVLADTAEGDAVVNLADLVQRARRILGHDHYAHVVGGGHQRPAPGNALLGVFRPVLHDLFGRHVVRHAHGVGSVIAPLLPPLPARSDCSARLRSTSAPKRSATSGSGTRR